MLPFSGLQKRREDSRRFSDGGAMQDKVIDGLYCGR